MGVQKVLTKSKDPSYVVPRNVAIVGRVGAYNAPLLVLRACG